MRFVAALGTQKLTNELVGRFCYILLPPQNLCCMRLATNPLHEVLALRTSGMNEQRSFGSSGEKLMGHRHLAA